MAEPLIPQLRTALAGRFEVTHELGRGGMAVVLLARDTRHDRRVAIKVLRHDVGSPVAAERFLHEIRTVAPLSHPHILPVFDSGQAAGHLYFVMPYIEGESLRQRLARTGPLPLDEALQIAREVADALHYAHERGVVHRDIKPENILLSAGHAVVADFGIAIAADAAGLRLTETGLAVGTPAYMSPEQAAADRVVDARSDQYSLACTVYEMLAGSPPFSGTSAQVLVARHSVDPVPPLSTVRRVPPEVEQALGRALAKSPADRWPSTRAFAAALTPTLTSSDRVSPTRPRRAVAAASLALVVLAAVAGLVFGSRSSASLGDASTRLHSVVVLPFRYSGDSEFAVLADGMIEGITAGLVRVQGLAVPSGGASRLRELSARLEDPEEIGRALGVDYVVHGDIQVVGRALRVVPRLIDVRQRVLTWQASFSGEIGDETVMDIFAVQDTVAERIVAQILPELPAGMRASAARGVRTKDLEAQRLYAEARTIPESREGNERAVELLRRALARDSSFADAWVELAFREFMTAGTSGLAPSETALRWRQAIERAIELDSLNARAFEERGYYRFVYERDFSGAERDLRRAVRLDPADTRPYEGLAMFLAHTGRQDSALKYARRAVQADSLSAWSWNILGKIFVFNGMLDSGISASERSLALDSTMWHTNWVLANGYLSRGQVAKADSAAERLGSSSGLRAEYLRRRRRPDLAVVVLDSLTRQRGTDAPHRSTIAAWRLAAGDTLGALEDIERAAEEREFFLVEGALTIQFAPLHRHPRFVAVRRSIFGDRELMPAPFP